MAICLSEFCTPLSPTEARFRTELRAGDPEAVERLVVRTGVFNREEIATARELVEDTMAHRPGADYHFVIVDGVDGLDAYACFGPIMGADRRYELYWIASHPACAQRGFGRALLTEVEAEVKALGGTHLFAETSTREDYRPAHNLYLACGYTMHAEVPDYHADGDGMAIYGKKL
jgi:ribosomal protein S18 acetylase RimI-like enzyme